MKGQKGSGIPADIWALYLILAARHALVPQYETQETAKLFEKTIKGIREAGDEGHGPVTYQ